MTENLIGNQENGLVFTTNEIDELEPEKIDGINFISFSRKKGAPFNLDLLLDYYEWPIEQKRRLLHALANPSNLIPAFRFRRGRREMTDEWAAYVQWKKGCGIEGHLIGLKREEIMEILSYYNNLIRAITSDHDQQLNHYPFNAERFLTTLEKFIRNPDLPISPYFAFFMSEVFGIIINDARQIRGKLQRMGVQENTSYQEKIYTIAESKSQPILILKNDKLVISFSSQSKSNFLKQGSESDVRQHFPYLAEIGRFGHPLLRILYGSSEILSLPNHHLPSSLTVAESKRKLIDKIRKGNFPTLPKVL